MSEHTSKVSSGIPTRLLWMICAPVEFVITILVGVLLFLLQAALIYFYALRGMFGGAFALLVWRFRVGPVSSSVSGGKISPQFPVVVSRRDPDGRQRFGSWLN